jgi:hypothetical protein
MILEASRAGPSEKENKNHSYYFLYQTSMAPEEGYAKIAPFMGRHGDLTIFRRFNRLNLQNLLYLQAQFTHMEKDLDELVERDKTDTSRVFYTRDWWALAESSEDKEGQEQWEKVVQIRETLKEYSNTSHLFSKTGFRKFPLTGWSEAPGLHPKPAHADFCTLTDEHLAQQVFLANLPPPKTYDLTFFRSWLRRPKMGNFPLRGPD